MTFDQWKRRPVCLVQVYTFHILRTLSVYSGASVLELRKVRTYRTAQGRLIRLAVACKIREMRRKCGLDRHHVRKEALNIIARPTGIAIRCDLETILG